MSWEKGRDVFDRLLIDGDAAINSGNWMWLSASAFFYQYFRVYSPVTYGKKYDKNGDFVRHFLPVLKVSHRRHQFLMQQMPLGALCALCGQRTPCRSSGPLLGGRDGRQRWHCKVSADLTASLGCCEHCWLACCHS